MKTTAMMLAVTAALFCTAPGPASADFGALDEITTRDETITFGTVRANLQRSLIAVPKAYGRLLTITTTGNATVLWFESDDGVIRNVRLEGANPVMLKREGELR